MLELAFRGDRALACPIYRQLADYLAGLVETGHLAPGLKLPATRELASSLGLSRNTVNQAYELLGEARLVRAHVGQGTFVAERRAAGAVQPSGPPGLAWEGLFAARTRRLTLPASLREPPARVPVEFDFRGGTVDPTALPAAELRRAFARAIGDSLEALANRLDPLGWGPLREEIARSLVARGIRCGADDVMVVAGAQQGLDLVARVLVDPGDGVALEEPGYFGARFAFQAREADLVPLPVDAGGLRTDALARVLRGRRLKLVYTTPAVQSPTGVVLGDARRAELLALAEQHQTPIVEDDYDSELRYAGDAGAAPTPALKAADPAGRVIYLGTFSKALFPSLRLGYVVGAPPLLRRAAFAQGAAHLGGSLLEQAALAELLRSGAFVRHVRRVRRRYAERRQAMLAALAEALPDAAVTPPAGGTAVWLRLPPDVDPAALRLDAADAGIAFSGGELFHLGEAPSQAIQLAFAALAPDRIARGVARLGEIVARRRAGGGTR